MKNIGFRIKRTIRLYLLYVSAVLQGKMQYKLSFFLMLIGRFLIAFNGFLAICFLFSQFTQIKGYSYSDVLLCYAVVQMSFSLAECVGSGFNGFSGMIKRGEFDRLLLRPCSPILQVLGTRFEIGRLGPVVSGGIMLGIGISNSQISWTAGRIGTLILMVAGGVLVFIGLFMLGASTCFFSIEDTSFINILTYGARDHGKYPIDVYGQGIMKFCTYIIPYTLIQYYPLQYLLGRTQSWWYGLYPLGTVVFAAICYMVWRFAVSRYQGCGG